MCFFPNVLWTSETQDLKKGLYLITERTHHGTLAAWPYIEIVIAHSQVGE